MSMDYRTQRQMLENIRMEKAIQGQAQQTQQQQQMQEQQSQPPMGQTQTTPQQANQVPDPLEILPRIVLGYMNYANGLMQRTDLDVGIQGKALLEVAQAIQFLTPMLPSSHQVAAQADAMKNQPNPADLQMKQAELQMKAQAHQQDLEHKAQAHVMDMQMKQHELGMKQQESQIKLATQAATSQQQLQQKEQTHQQNIVHSEQQAKIQQQQAKQATQTKPTKKQGK